MNYIDLYKKDVTMLCDSHSVCRLYIFGSALTPGFTRQSDVDFLVRFNDIPLAGYFDNYSSLKEKLEELFARPVDLLEEQAIKNPILKDSINLGKQLLYERENVEISL